MSDSSDYVSTDRIAISDSSSELPEGEIPEHSLGDIRFGGALIHMQLPRLHHAQQSNVTLEDVAKSACCFFG